MNNQQKGKYRKNPARTELKVDRIAQINGEGVAILSRHLESLASTFGVPPHLFGRTPCDSATEAEAAHNLFLRQLNTTENKHLKQGR